MVCSKHTYLIPCNLLVVALCEYKMLKYSQSELDTIAVGLHSLRYPFLWSRAMTK